MLRVKLVVRKLLEAKRQDLSLASLTESYLRHHRFVPVKGVPGPVAYVTHLPHLYFVLFMLEEGDEFGLDRQLQTRF